jgi:phenylpyruvate tautomerase PptA (4-oxalocrotonate tautomerase family)
MPVTQITLLPGYSPEVRTRLVERVSQAVRSVIDAPEAGTTTCVIEAATYRRDGRVFAAGNVAHPVACERVQAYLVAMEQRDLALAQTFLASDFEMCFPGGVRMRSLDELVHWARGRYRFVRKTTEAWDESWQGDVTVVHCHGTLAGEWLDGTPFHAIRYIDRFELLAGLIRRQDVWNDLGETRARQASPMDPRDA